MSQSSMEMDNHQDSMVDNHQDSIVDRLSEDDLNVIFNFLPFDEKVKCERVCRKWRVVAGRLVAGQKAIGNAATNLSLVDHCRDRRHWVTALDCVAKRVLTNLSLLPKILQKCPDLRALSITKPKEPTFAEASSSGLKPAQCDPGHPFNNPFGDRWPPPEFGPEDLAAMQMESFEGVTHHSRDGVESSSSASSSSSSLPESIEMRRDAARRDMVWFYHGLEHRRYHELPMCKRRMASLMKMKKTEPRPVTLEDFLDMVGKYCKNLECIDIYGLRMNRGYRSDGNPAGSWKSILDSCPSLVHLRTFQLSDKEFGSMVARIPLTDISVVHGMKGDHLDLVGSTFRKMCIPSMKEFGLQRLIEAPNLDGLRELSLANVTRPVLAMVTKLTTLDTLNLSLGMNNLEPEDLSRLGKLKNLTRLYIKRREEPFEKFDRPLNDILSSCPNLVSIRLTNVIVSDSSVKNVNQCQLESFIIQLTSGKSRDQGLEKSRDQGLEKSRMTLTDLSLEALSEGKFLQRVEIDYPNTFTENTLIDYLFRAHPLSHLKIHGCKELIPINQIALAAVRQAARLERNNRILTIDIDTREKMEIGPLKQIMRFRPKNLHYTISTALDIFSTKYPDGRPEPTSDLDEDFDEHRTFFFEAVE